MNTIADIKAHSVDSLANKDLLSQQDHVENVRNGLAVAILSQLKYATTDASLSRTVFCTLAETSQPEMDEGEIWLQISRLIEARELIVQILLLDGTHPPFWATKILKLSAPQHEKLNNSLLIGTPHACSGKLRDTWALPEVITEKVCRYLFISYFA